MHIISVYNDKGGVGKSTLVVGLAEFLAANRKKRVLVIDLDAQASSSSGFLGRRKSIAAVDEGRTISHLLKEIAGHRSPQTSYGNFLYTRKEPPVVGTRLARLSVLPANKPGMLQLEDEVLRVGRDESLLRDFLRPQLEAGFDFVLIDMPSNVKPRDTIVMNGLVMSDFVLIPTEPSQIALDALPNTFDLIAIAQKQNRTHTPAVIGMVLNQTDRRSQQYRSKLPQIIEKADGGELPAVFQHILGDHPQMMQATDYTLNPKTLKQRFGTYYDNVRRVAVELQKRCDGFDPRKHRSAEFYATKIRQILSTFTPR